jgi:hypothetical protein
MASVDPAALGTALLLKRERFRSIPLHELADGFDWSCLPVYDPTESLGSAAHRKYHDELQARAAQGDHHARNILLGLSNDDPGGS